MDVNTQFLTEIGLRVGDRLTLTVPASAITIYHPAELLQFTASGLAIAAVGALMPAGWAAVSRTTTALHAE